MVAVSWRGNQKHYVLNGMVGCPVQGHDVDADLCLGCPGLVEPVRDASRLTAVVCKTGLSPSEVLTLYAQA